jgi:hypothetical protein
MRLKKAIQTFSSACEHLLGNMAIHRPPTEDEVLLVKHYCCEVLRKFDSPSTNPAQLKIPPSQ